VSQSLTLAREGAPPAARIIPRTQDSPQYSNMRARDSRQGLSLKPNPGGTFVRAAGRRTSNPSKGGRARKAKTAHSRAETAHCADRWTPEMIRRGLCERSPNTSSGTGDTGRGDIRPFPPIQSCRCSEPVRAEVGRRCRLCSSAVGRGTAIPRRENHGQAHGGLPGTGSCGTTARPEATGIPALRTLPQWSSAAHRTRCQLAPGG
jgi:hypothetical protein